MTVSEVGIKPTGRRPRAVKGGRRLSIMLVDGGADDARLTAEMLREHDPAVILTICGSVDEAARALPDPAPDCVLLDLGAPATDDLDGVSQILSAAPGIPIVVLTGVEDDRAALAGIGRGAQDYVAKSELAAVALFRRINLAIERARLTRDLTHRAHHDSLTGLPNRALFERRVDEAIKSATRSGAGFSVMLVSVEDLKSINDNFGHALGDEVLREGSRRLAGGLEDPDSAYRYAGAEFAVICQTAEHPVGATSIAEWIRDSICGQPVVVGVRSLNIGVSIGVAIASAEDTTPALLHRLDGAVYEARLTGGGCVVD